MEVSAALPIASDTGSRRLLPFVGLGIVVALLAGANVVGGAATSVGLLVGASAVLAIGTRPEYAVAILLGSFLVTTPTWLQGRGALTLNNVIGMWLLIIFAYRYYQSRDPAVLQTREVQLLAAIGGVFLVSRYLHQPDRFTMDMITPLLIRDQDPARVFIGRFAFLVFLIAFIRKPSQIRLIFVLAIAAMVMNGLAGIQRVLSGGGFAGYRARSALLIAAAGNPNRLALFSVIGLIAIWYFIQHRRQFALYLAPLVPAMVVAVFMTGSRSGVGGLGFSSLLLFLEGGFSGRKLVIATLGGFVAAFLIVRAAPERSLERIRNIPGTAGAQEELGRGSLQRREYAASLAVELAKRNPIFGVGIGNWEIERFLADPVHNTVPPHSAVLLTLVEGGLAAVGLYLVLIGRTLRNLIRCAAALRGAPGWRGDLAWIAASLRTGFLAFLAFSLVADIWMNIVFYWFVGLSVALRRLVSGEEEANAWAVA